MRKLLLIAMGFGIAQTTRAQNPVHWDYSAQKLDNKTYEVHITANIQEGWHIYAQQQPEDAIALPTKIKFNKNPLVKIQGKTAEWGRLEKHSIEGLGIQQYQYAGKVDFVQVVAKTSEARTSLSGSIAFQVCTDEQCLPPSETHFNLAL